ncbi:hypothetical protein MYE70_10620 [Marinobacter alexandrii]|uniref:hypothetical protein n=1 Tax=Marinobacter alexandrii TaxID=2570351 RepID=UPI0011096943|nr:hypothetical protein [Marinobacter alexandrii]MCK2149519.1 hypothetical protein [Marinobacter alexandrii]
MSNMKLVNLTADGTVSLGNSAEDVNTRGGTGSLMIMPTGTFGSGTLVVQKYSEARSAFVTVATYTAPLVDAEEVKLGLGDTQLVLSGATSPNIDVDYWWM